MRILLISEGKHEGSEQPQMPQSLLTLVNKVLEIEPTAYEWRYVKSLPQDTPIPGSGKGFVRVGLRALQAAERERFTAVILVLDNDCQPERQRELKTAQEHTSKFTVPRAFGIAVETYDAWILADYQALGRALQTHVPMQPLPETFTGKNDTPKHPKEVCRKLMEQYQWEGNQAAFYQAVVQEADLAVLADRCPKGFGPFLERLQNLRQSLESQRSR